jgi:7-cyano-7-deazaguanine synthase
MIDMKAVVLLSGGLDSATAAAVAKSQGFELYALSFDYGQRHKKELQCARRVGDFFGIKEHRLLSIDLPWARSALTSEDIPVPEDSFDPTSVPVTYVPARNIIFLAFAASYAEALGASDVFAGMNAVDYSGYPDCRPQFLHAFQEALNLGTKSGAEGSAFNIRTPLAGLTKAEIVRYGLKLGVDYSLTWSCYKGGEKACGHCDSCLLRLKGFREAGVQDPLEYENGDQIRR